jgi:hypothetical protein
MSLTRLLSIMRSQLLGLLAQIAIERGDLEVALDFAHRATHTAREDFHPMNPDAPAHLSYCLGIEADVLEKLGRLDEVMALDAEWTAVTPGKTTQGAMRRGALRSMALGRDAEAEQILRNSMNVRLAEYPKVYSRRLVESDLRPHTVLAELLERRGTEEALAEARTLRHKVAEQLAIHEAGRAAALEETRAAAAEAVRQWRRERIKAKGEKRGKKKGKGKKKGRKGKSKGKAAAASTAAIEGESPHEPAGGEAEGAAPAEAEQQFDVGESQPQGEEKEGGREECAI